MRNRIIFGVLFFVSAVVFIYIGGYAFIAYFLFLAIRSQWEMLRALKVKGYRPYYVPPMLFAGLIYPVHHFFGIEGILMLFLLCGSLILLGSIRKPVDRYGDVLSSLAALFYPSLLWVCFLMLYIIPDESIRFLSLGLVVVIPVLSDTFALFFGMNFGKHKLAPDISPKKSIEGSIAGLFGGVAAGIIVFFIFNALYTIDIPIYHFAIMGFIGSIFAQIGDLTASAIKRYVNIKDFGRLIPGHGGLMDRLDSVLMASLPLYIYLTLVIL